MNKKIVHLRIPGSTANLGSGFDTLGLSLSIYSEFIFKLVDNPSDTTPLISLSESLIGKLTQDQSNLVYQTLSHFWTGDPDHLKHVRISIGSAIPLGAGLGSSSTAIIAGAWAAQAFTGNTPNKELILNQVSALEGHSDNAAASLYGGLVVTAKTEKGIRVEKVQWPDDWATLVAVPDYSVATKTARDILPKQIPLSDCVFNLQHLGLFLSSVVQHDESALAESLDDKIHQPSRQQLIPEFQELKQKCQSLSIIGCVLSGAGPSILILVNEKSKKKVIDHLSSWAKEKKVALLDLSVDPNGILELTQ